MVKLRVLALMAAAILVVGLLAVPGLATFTDTDSGDMSSSEAEISVVDCVVESTKDISYIAFLDSGDELERDESVDAESFDLSGFDGIEDVSSVEVKSGQTVESFGVDCGDTAGTDEEPTEDPAEDPAEDPTEDPTDDGDVQSHNDKAGANSQATVTLSGCTLNSSKDISYIAFLSDGDQVDKIEGVDATSFDLDGYDGIDEVDAVRVKAGTTVATFGVNCGDATTAGDDSHGDKDGTDSDDHATDDEHDDDASGDDDATDEDDDVVKDEDSDDSDDSDDDDAETDGEWDARHDGRHEHKDHEEIDHEDS